MWKEIYHFCFVLLCIRGQIPSTSPPTGAYIWRGDLTEGFLHYDFEGFYLEGLIHGGAYFQNFMVAPQSGKNLQTLLWWETSLCPHSTNVCKISRL